MGVPDPRDRKRAGGTARGKARSGQSESVRRSRVELIRRIDDSLDVPFAILSLIWVVLLIVELGNLAPADWSVDVYRLDTLIWAMFLGHFLLELAIAPSKRSYLRTHWLTAISVALPFLRIIRFVRVVRLLRTLSFARILLSANRATRSAGAVLSAHRFGYVTTVVLILALLGAASAYYFEQGVPNSPLANFGEAVWWAATMVTTINVGAEPVTVGGRAIGLLLRIVGLALFSYVAGSVASYFVGTHADEDDGPPDATARELRRMGSELARISRLLAEREAAHLVEPDERPAGQDEARPGTSRRVGPDLS